MNYQLLVPLTSLRFFAAVMIVLHHAFGIVSFYPTSISLDSAVSFFFILSGFIIAYRYRSFDSLRDMFHFLKLRLIRLYPIHLLVFFLFIVCGLVTNTLYFSPKIVTSNVLLLQSLIPESAYYFSFSAVSWALSAELMFYIFYCIFSTNKRTYFCIYCLLFVYALFVISKMNILPYGDINAGQGFVVSKHGLLYINPFIRFFEFLLGVCTCYIFSLYKMCANRLLATFFEIAALGIFIWSMCNFGVYFSYLHFIPIDYFMHVYCSFSIALLILVMGYGKGYISHVMQNRTLVLLGESSFSIFMIHGFFISIYYIYIAQFELNKYICFLSVVFLSILSGVAIYKYIEIPSTRMLKKWLEPFFKKSAV